MRLVSAIWAFFHPFHLLGEFTEQVRATTPDELKEGDILIIHGGSDIHPSLYGKGRSRLSGAGEQPSSRDVAEWNLMARAIDLNIPIIGICRGAQMLCAHAGGTLYQHVNNHGGMHAVKTHDDVVMRVNSMHHQMMNLKGTEHKLIAWTAHNLSDVYYDENRLPEHEYPKLEPEFVFFPELKGFAIQWHPECIDETDESTVYINKFIKEQLNV